MSCIHKQVQHYKSPHQVLIKLIVGIFYLGCLMAPVKQTQAEINYQDTPPIANDDTGILNPGKSVMLDILANDYSPNGRLMSLIGDFNNDCSVNVVVNIDDTLTITALQGYTGSCRLSYIAATGNLQSSPAYIVLTSIASSVSTLIYQDGLTPINHDSLVDFGSANTGDPLTIKSFSIINSSESSFDINLDLSNLSEPYTFTSDLLLPPNYSTTIESEQSIEFQVALPTTETGEFFGSLSLAHSIDSIESPYRVHFTGLIEEPVCSQEAYTTVSIPGVIQAEHYDSNANGGHSTDCGYIDLSPGNNASEPRFRPQESVDARDYGTAVAVTNFQAGEQLTYQVQSVEQGVYRIEARYSTDSATEQPLQLDLLLGNNGELGQWSLLLEPTNSGNSSVFSWNVLNDQPLATAAATELNIHVGSGAANLDSIEFIQIADASDIPQAVDDHLIANGELTTIEIDAAFLLGNDHFNEDWSIDSPRIELVNPGNNITLHIDELQRQSVIVDDVNWTGNQNVFQYRITQGALVSEPAWASIDVDPNAIVVLANDDYLYVPAQLHDTTINGGGPAGSFHFGHLAMIANDFTANPDGIELSLPSNTTSARGSIIESTQAPNRYAYRPSRSLLTRGGEDSFEYQIDVAAGASVANMHLTIIRAPFAMPDGPYDLIVDQAFSIPLQVLIDNDMAYLQPIGLVIDSLQLDGPGTITYDQNNHHVIVTPASTSVNAFSYQIFDGLGQRSNSTTVSLNVIGRPPHVSTISESLLTAIQHRFQYVLDPISSATDPDGDQLTLTHVSDSQFGSTTIINNQVAYLLSAGAQGQDVLTYDITDGEYTVTGEIIVDLRSVNPPLGTNDSFDHPVNTGALILSTSQLLHNDIGADIHILDISTNDPGATVTLQSILKRVVYTPAPGFTGEAGFSYRIKDAVNQVSDSISVSIRIF